MRVNVQPNTPAALPSVQHPSSHRIEHILGPIASLEFSAMEDSNSNCDLGYFACLILLEFCITYYTGLQI